MNNKQKKNIHQTKIVVDLERASIVAKSLINSFLSKQGIFKSQGIFIEEQLPNRVKYRSREHLLFLFYLISQDYATKSSILYRRAKVLYESYPEYFSPTFIVKKCDIDFIVRNICKKLGVRYPYECALRWYEN